MQKGSGGVSLCGINARQQLWFCCEFCERLCLSYRLLPRSQTNTGKSWFAFVEKWVCMSRVHVSCVPNTATKQVSRYVNWLKNCATTKVSLQLLLRTWLGKLECLQLAVLPQWLLQYLQSTLIHVWGRCGSVQCSWSLSQEDRYPKSLISPQIFTDAVEYPHLRAQIGVCWWIKFWRYSL